MGFGGGTNTVSETKLAPEQAAILKLALPAVRETAANPPKLYPGSAIAPFTPLQQYGQQAAVDTAVNFLNPLAASTASASQNVQQSALPLGTQGLGSLIGGLPGAEATGDFLLSGALLDPNTNPVFDQQVEAAIRPLQRTLTRDVLPQIGREAVSAGQYGGSRQGIAEGLAISDFTQQSADVATNLAANNFNQGLSAAQQALNSVLGAGTAGVDTALSEGVRSLFAAPTLGDLALRPAGVLEAVGGQQRTLQQAQLSEEASRYTTEQLIPFLIAQDIAGIAYGGGGGTGITSQSGGGSGAQYAQIASSIIPAIITALTVAAA